MQSGPPPRRPAPKLLATVAWRLAVAVLAGQPALGEETIVPEGRGAYTTARPESIASPPDEIFRTSDVSGPTPTNQWWSSLVWEPLSSNMFPHPLGMVCTQQGLSVSYPGAGVVGSSGHIMGSGVSENGDVVIGLADAEPFPAARLAGYSQWFITAQFAAGKSQLRASFGHGSPYIYCRHVQGSPLVRFADTPNVWYKSPGGACMGVTVRGSHYGIFGAKGSRWAPAGEKALKNVDSQGYFSVALLPDNASETFELFAKYAHNHVVDTQARFRSEAGYLHTSYAFTTASMEGDTRGTLYALYPHHWKYSDAELTDMTYRSVRGTMKVAQGEGFETTAPIQGVLPMLPKQGVKDRRQMVAYLRAAAADMTELHDDTYWDGKRLGKLATLSGIADAINEQDLQSTFVGELKRSLGDWLTASPNETSHLFYYNANWGSLIGAKASYGTDSQLNDHHFHYGYFIRAAAEVARVDPEWAEAWAPMVNLLIRDIASPDASDPMFPQLRGFDMYAGHSWASGHAMFGDGNNQESSSESMNAWYAIMLWGAVTGDSHLRDLGVALYNTERTAIEEYWFDVSGTNFPDDFPNVALGMIWGGKGSFETWFSGDIDHVHGINWLPFTPASIYMGRHPEYVKENYDRIVAQREAGDDFSVGWGDLVVMFGALHDPAPAAVYINANPHCVVENGNTRAFMYHWIHTLARLGNNDASVTADYPFFNVYVKDGVRTYAIYNFADEPRTVRFSDGASVQAAANGLTVLRDGQL